jgi:hypothetical protein
MFRIMFYMQKCLKNRFLAREAKIDILDNAWFKFLGKLQHRQIEVGDEYTSDVVQSIVIVKP